MKKFHPEHVNACMEDFEGNNGIGRYIFLPGSDGRAKEIAEGFSNVIVKEHSRRHNLYKGVMAYGGKKIDAAVISTGMGAPSLDIIATELISLGAKRFLRVGTCGPLQDYMKMGDFVIATSAVRDDGTTQCYMPLEIPALASFDTILAAERAAARLRYTDRTYYGVVHSKSSLYGREFSHESPLRKANADYMRILKESGVIASEMETAILFVLASLKNAVLKPSKGVASVKAGAVCVAVTEGDKFVDKKRGAIITADLLNFSLAIIGEMALKELKDITP